ncbi:MAG: WD40 repeat domain-containing protein [Ktedonobacterales bacterium]
MSARLSRRAFIGLAATAALAGCAPASLGNGASSATPLAARPPASSAPHGPITAANAQALRQLGAFSPDAGQARGVAWSRDGRLLAAGCDETIMLWDMRDPGSRVAWHGHRGQIVDLAWSPDGKRLASASQDGAMRLWEMGRAQSVLMLTDPDGATPLSVAWSPDSARLACGTYDGATLTFDATSGARLQRWDGPPMVGRGDGGRYPFANWGVAWSADGRTVAATRYDDLIQLFTVETGAATYIPKTDYQPNRIAWAPTGDMFASSDDQGKLQIWNAGSGKRIASMLDHPEAGWSFALAWSPDGSLIGMTRATGLIQVYSVAEGRQLVARQAHDTASWALAWSPDDLRLASGGDDAKVCLWGA